MSWKVPLITRRKGLVASFIVPTLLLTACSGADGAQVTSAGGEGQIRTEVELTAPDGTPLTLSYPADIDFTSAGVEVATEPVLDSPDIRLEGTSGNLLVFINDCARMTRLDEETYGAEVFAFCDQPSNTLFFVAGSPEAQRRIHLSLRVNR